MIRNIFSIWLRICVIFGLPAEQCVAQTTSSSIIAGSREIGPGMSTGAPAGLGASLDRKSIGLGGSAGTQWSIGVTDTPDATLYLNSYNGTGIARTILTVDKKSSEIRSTLGWFVENSSSDHPLALSQRTIGFSGIAINDNIKFVQNAYGIYGEARRLADAGAAQASEFNALNGGTTVDIDPYNALGAITAATWLSAGRSDLTYNNPVSVAAAIIPNGAVFRRGFVFRAGSLDRAGALEAITLPVDYKVSWYSAEAAPVANLSANAHGGGTLNVGKLPVYGDNEGAAKGGLVPGDLYRTSTGRLMVRY